MQLQKRIQKWFQARTNLTSEKSLHYGSRKITGKNLALRIRKIKKSRNAPGVPPPRCSRAASLLAPCASPLSSALAGTHPSAPARSARSLAPLGAARLGPPPPSAKAGAQKQASPRAENVDSPWVSIGFFKHERGRDSKERELHRSESSDSPSVLIGLSENAPKRGPTSGLPTGPKILIFHWFSSAF